jgi:hypothetical protein
MANEATLVLKYEDPIDFTVADGADITKGAILKLTTPRTASLATSGAVIAGIAARDKVDSDGRTRLAVFRRGVFRLYASGSVTAGYPVRVIDTNQVINATADFTGSSILGIALEDISDGDAGEVELNIGAGNVEYS